MTVEGITMGAKKAPLARAEGRRAPAKQPLRSSYQKPTEQRIVSLNDLLKKVDRSPLEKKQLDLLGRGDNADIDLYYAGLLDILGARAVSIVGTREVSAEGAARARKLARELAAVGVVVVSGLAKGVDAEALSSAIDAGGKTVAVIGTPLSKAYPAENSKLQETIYREHLLISPFADGEQVFRSNFPKRNRVMAALSDATVIVEASDTSGTLHQAAECQRLGRWLFIMRSVAEDPGLSWPRNFIGKPNVAVLSKTSDIFDALKFQF
jgi:DNA protecting protein DprA